MTENSKTKKAKSARFPTSVSSKNTNVNPDTDVVVYLDVSIRGGPPERMEFELFRRTHPKTAENFLQLCIGANFGKKTSNPKVVSYTGTLIHRVQEFMIQGGNLSLLDSTFAAAHNIAPRPNESIYGPTFEDELPYGAHEAGSLCMASTGPNTNSCCFYIATQRCEWLDGKHVVFGRLTTGLDVMYKLADLCPGSLTGDLPGAMAVVVGCGVSEPDEYHVQS